ncbi:MULTISPECIES: Fe-S cluster assembly protein SufB [Peptoniphilus]|uniref:Fe-S cluster assembly protein SufB n=1 Tax=Peptoniphilus TaxID=162289 RepID=UPI0001DCA854|nr:Fe-S cluster assembly protein SufB [Peptoniphilus sp. oral taxon 836]EFK39602.1 FeS assembly protein SufB [Peptoniphilus sp. oral taxon 836 str. F0141]
MTKKERTYVEDMDRGIYDIKNAFEYRYKTSKGLNEEIVREISEEKNEPEWMLDYRLKALEIFNNSKNPVWGPDLSDVNIEDITTYIRPKADLSTSWEDLPEDIRNTFDKLGIPEAEKKQFLSGVGAQYDSEVVYHSIQKYLRDQGVIYTDFESGLREYPEIVKKYFGTCIKPELHRYAALHYAVWSGGSFVYVPEGVNVDIPLQSYFRLNAPGAGQFEHTLIILEKNSYCHFIEGCSAPRYNVVNLHAGAVELFVAENSTLRYSTIENWSRNMYNLNTKRAIVEKNGKIQWISGSFGSKVSMLYPTSVLKGEGSTSEFTGISFAGAGQNLDTGAQVVHLAPNTNSFIDTKSISKNGGIAVYRGLVEFSEDAKNSKNTTSCESLMLDEDSRSDTIPTIRLKNSEVDVGHEAKIGKISDQVIFYLMTRGLSEEDAKQLVVRGFAEPVAKELPMEYAVEMNNLINLELVGSIG